jgi:hypothetical protein
VIRLLLVEVRLTLAQTSAATVVNRRRDAPHQPSFPCGEAESYRPACRCQRLSNNFFSRATSHGVESDDPRERQPVVMGVAELCNRQPTSQKHAAVQAPQQTSAGGLNQTDDGRIMWRIQPTVKPLKNPFRGRPSPQCARTREIRCDHSQVHLPQRNFRPNAWMTGHVPKQGRVDGASRIESPRTAGAD